MKRKWLVTLFTSMLAVTLVTGCGMSNDNNNEPVDEVPTDRNVDDQDLENNTDRKLNDDNLRDDDNLEENFDGNDRTNENNQENQ